ncbi:uncharacterized protein NECHADRAFT_83308 [Fusarium vanettenii 77-13-4]|uniref:Uncharacterized protein n=1 Tax=Fusarium vanettenii (strain ATCC MYA-4622 / CBS 123669 / FGSC 9596 / NRRL 45880 / 77-13-4) TaxID=660122 RepID=C7Z3N1_FUSV7|nr:uncharacterized protein NECHADRAFT_83308 [Fusarium vanettenii 77-13-4]EEU41339.1 hypothetical protein NECHADRAFT_83308 [Fusarium vanettenii 77-13-4]
MDTEDIRKHYDLVTQSEKVSWVLETRLPTSLDDVSTEGLDCLIVVLRRIFSAVMISEDCLANLSGFKQSETENPILAFSWLMLGEPEGNEARAQALKAKRALIEAVPDALGSFENLWRSAMMNRTLWQKKLFHLFGPKYHMPPGEPIKCNEWNRDEIAGASIVQLNRVVDPQRTLQEAIDNCFGFDDENTLFIPYRPRIIRVVYTPGTDERLPFQALREFFLPQGDVKDVDGNLRYVQDSPPERYALIAVVRMRSESRESDYVRTYAVCGANTAARNEHESYTPGSWLIEEPSSHNFVLFFCLAEDEVLIPEYPELAKAGFMVPSELESLIEEDLARSLQGLDLTAMAAKFAPPQCRRTEPPPPGTPRPASRGPEPSLSTLPEARRPIPKTRPTDPLSPLPSLPKPRRPVPKTQPTDPSSKGKQAVAAAASAGGNQKGANPKRGQRGKGKNAAPGRFDRPNHQNRGGGQGKNGAGRGRNSRRYSPPPSSQGQRARDEALSVAAGVPNVAGGALDIAAEVLNIAGVLDIAAGVLDVERGVLDIAVGALIVVGTEALRAEFLDVEAGALDAIVQEAAHSS